MLDEYTRRYRHSISTILTKLVGMMVVTQISTAQYFINLNKPLVDNTELQRRYRYWGSVVYFSKLPSPQISSPGISSILTKLVERINAPQISTAQYLFIQTSP